jgi:hypothetical protein
MKLKDHYSYLEKSKSLLNNRLLSIILLPFLIKLHSDYSLGGSYYFIIFLVFLVVDYFVNKEYKEILKIRLF